MLKKRRNRRSGRSLGRVEALENRNLLAADLVVAGDSNNDGVFNSTDIVQVFQEGRFESDEAADHGQGDWNGDGRFDTADFVFAFQNSEYEADPTISLGAEAGEEVVDADGADVDADVDGGEGEEVNRDRHNNGRGRGERGDRGNNGNRIGAVTRVLEGLTEAIANEDLPAGLSAEDAQRIVDGLTTAIEAGDREAVAGLLGELREATQAEREAERAEREAARDAARAEREAQRLQQQVDRLQAAVDAAGEAGEESVGGLPVADVQAAVTAASEALAAGDAEAATEALQSLREARNEVRAVARLQSKIESLQSAVAEATEAGEETLKGLPVADVQGYVDAAATAFADGNVDEARSQLEALDAARKEARLASRVQAVIEGLEAALAEAAEAGEETIRGVAVADVEAAVVAAKAALAEGNLDAASEALSVLRQRGDREGRPGKGNGRDHGRGRGDRGDRGDDGEVDEGEVDEGEVGEGEGDADGGEGDRSERTTRPTRQGRGGRR